MAADMSQLPAAFFNQKSSGKHAAPVVVGADVRDARRNLPVEGDERQIHLLVGLYLQRVAAHDDAVNPACAQHINVLQLLVLVLPGIAEQQLAAVTVGVLLYVAGEFPKKRMRNAGNNQSDNIRP
ncbi:hypothetical protein D3C72_1877990 [compost metagenome]